MPLHQVTCSEHGQQEVFVKTAQSVTYAPCPVCRRRCLRDWVPAASLPFRSYWSDGLSTGLDPVHITSRAQENTLCKELDCARVN